MILFTQPLLSQSNDQMLFTLEYHYGINSNAYTFDDVAKPFLDEGLGTNRGLDMNIFLFTKREHLIQFSGNINTINFVLSPSNLIYEFGYSYNDDCCWQVTGFYAFTGGVKYLLPFYKTDKLEFLGGIGANINIDIGTTAVSDTYEGRVLWSSADNKRGPAIFPSVDLSTRLIYFMTDKFLVTANASLIHAPFYALDYTYVINSRDGMFTGLFYQKLSSAVLGIGLGMKL
ncbi:MAG: hypothetical protein HC803_08175 [Saprospiraceae bacterium]|nr:hypothetical protein [Saprospiraceae bacterium]